MCTTSDTIIKVVLYKQPEIKHFFSLTMKCHFLFTCKTVTINKCTMQHFSEHNCLLSSSVVINANRLHVTIKLDMW